MKRFFLALAAAASCLALSGPGHARAADRQTAADAGSTSSLYLLLIRQARADGRPRAAIAYLDDFERKVPGDREALLLRVNCLLDLGQVQAARAALARIPADDRNGEVAAARGHVLAAEGHWAQAAEEYSAALAAHPANPLIGNALGYAQLRLGRPAEAVETLKGASDLAPRNAVVRNNLLLALTMAGRAGEAEAAIGAIPEPGVRSDLRRQIAEQSARLWGSAEARP